MVVVILFRESVAIDSGLKIISCGGLYVGFVKVNSSMLRFFR